MEVSEGSKPALKVCLKLPMSWAPTVRVHRQADNTLALGPHNQRPHLQLFVYEPQISILGVQDKKDKKKKAFVSEKGACKLLGNKTAFEGFCFSETWSTVSHNISRLCPFDNTASDGEFSTTTR